MEFDMLLPDYLEQIRQLGEKVANGQLVLSIPSNEGDLTVGKLHGDEKSVDYIVLSS